MVVVDIGCCKRDFQPHQRCWFSSMSSAQHLTLLIYCRALTTFWPSSRDYIPKCDLKRQLVRRRTKSKTSSKIIYLTLCNASYYTIFISLLFARIVNSLCETGACLPLFSNLEINCGSLGPLYNGWMENVESGAGLGAAVIFHCDNHMLMEGSTSSICQSDGTWRYPPPLCLGKWVSLNFVYVVGRFSFLPPPDIEKKPTSWTICTA